ncbi:hypothetical protein AOLI_G00166560 [Acnodon oligacanthus]
MERIHHMVGKEGPTAPLQPQAAEEVWYEPAHPQSILLMYCGERSSSSITSLYGNCPAIEWKAVQRVVRKAQHITGVQLPNLLDLYTSRCLKKTRRTLKDSTHSSHCLFSQLPSGRRSRSIKSRTSWFRDSFFPRAVRLVYRSIGLSLHL